MRKELGSLAKHRAYLGRPAKAGSVVPFPMKPSAVFARQVAALGKFEDGLRRGLTPWTENADK